MSSSSDFSDKDVTRILQIIDQLTDVEVRVEFDGMKLHVRKFSGSGPGPAQTSLALPSSQPSVALAPPETVVAEATPVPAKSASAKPEVGAEAPPDTIAIRSPMLGRMFRSPSPTEPPFVEIGSKVEPDDTVCIIEVMKLFNTVKAGVRGTIASIAVENGQMVEYDAVLFFVKPA